MSSKNLVGAATRYIAGRNIMQTVYWRSSESSGATSTSTADTPHKMVKVFRNVNFGKSADYSAPPMHVREAQQLRV